MQSKDTVKSYIYTAPCFCGCGMSRKVTPDYATGEVCGRLRVRAEGVSWWTDARLVVMRLTGESPAVALQA